ncbi:MAG: hypothetical protein GX242_04440 [Clostridiales bacterium]|nr:hypothetical protein [Clostridiales bacterium]
MNIVDYIRRKEQEKNRKNSENNDNQQNISPQDALNKYSQMSENELMTELFKEGSVSSGKVSAQELDNFYNSASGYLNQEQRNKMKMLIEQLKRS